MRALASRVLIVAAVIAGCLSATYFAATLALQRPNSWRIDAALASRLTADYSADDYASQVRRPLNPGVVDAARDDEEALDPARTPQAVPPASTVEPPATPTTQPSAATPVPAAPSSTPEPLPTHTPTPKPEPSDTPEPPATNTPVPSPTATPRTVTCGKDGELSGGACKTASSTPTRTPLPPTPTITPTATPRSIIGCLPLVGPLIGGDKCGTSTPTPEPDGEEGG